MEENDDAVRQEMEYTTYEDSCLNPTISPDGVLRVCRRTRGHWTKGTRCASGNPVVYWDRE